jgi:hypothetical protein
MKFFTVCFALFLQLNMSCSYSQTAVFTKSLNQTLYNLSVFQDTTDRSLYAFKKWRYAQAPGIDLIQYDSTGTVLNNIAINTSNSFATNILPFSGGFIAGTANYLTHVPTFIKSNSSGNVLWNNSLQYPGGLNAEPAFVSITDNEIFTIGSPPNSAPGFHQLFLIKSDTNGILNSSLSYNLIATGGTFGLTAEQFHKLNNGNYLYTAGLLTSCVTCLVPYYLLLDSNFNIIASNSVITSQGIPLNFKFIKKPDDSFYLIGSIISNTPNYLYYGFVINFDAAFNTIWSVYTDNINSNFGLELIDASVSLDNGIVIGGNYTNSNGWSDMMLLKMDSLGNILWNSRYGTDSDDEKLISLINVEGDGNYLSGSGYDTTFVANTVNGLLIKTDLFGKTACDTTSFFININPMNISLITETFTQSNITVSSTPISSSPLPGMTLLPVCNGVVSTIVEISNDQNVAVFPNPANSLITISGFHVDSETDLSLTDIIGQTIYPYFSIINNEINVHTGNLKPGVYLLKLADKRNFISKKIVIVD